MHSLNESSPRAEQPVRIKTALKPHQLAMLKACEDFENKNMNASYDELTYKIGLIGDKVGAGKSLMALSIIANNQHIKQSDNFNAKIKKKPVLLLIIKNLRITIIILIQIVSY